jgi:hypothetical protein
MYKDMHKNSLAAYSSFSITDWNMCELRHWNKLTKWRDVSVKYSSRRSLPLAYSYDNGNTDMFH